MLSNVNDVVPVGKAIAVIQTEESGSVKTVPAIERSEKKETSKTAISTQQPPIRPAPEKTNSAESRFYSPLVLNISRSEGISMSELESLPGTGAENRVTKGDLLNYVRQKKERGPATQQARIDSPEKTGNEQKKEEETSYRVPSAPVSGNVEIIEMDRMRKLIADHMVMSKRTSAHVTSFVEADVTNLVMWRGKVKDQFEKREGEKITFTPLFIEAVVKAIKDFPLVNASVEGTKIIRKKDINIGMAAALPSGNLIVPVIRNAHTKNLVGLTKEVNDLARRARSNQLKPNEIEGGTFTITNVGTFGNVMGTPIINQPQVAILATGTIKKKPAVLETSEGDVIAIRHMMFLSLSYDHRVVDGALGGSFLRKVADYLEGFDGKREF
jgi:2-oxoglutarate dehydrogenase E2 component (dihydrolipoamide succinyltransferase)